MDDDDKTIWCGNLAEKVNEELLYELFLQAGPLERVKIPRDRDGRLRNFGFITYAHEVSVPYALNLFRGTALFHKTLQLQSRGRMVFLPPSIRGNGSETVDFNASHVSQFNNITEREENLNSAYKPIHRNDSNDKLTLASLQGNWSHRQHPYKAKEKVPKNGDFRYRDDVYNNDVHKNDAYSNKNSNNWRRRRDNRSRRK